MRLNRVGLLGVLESVSPGLASKEILEQSSCFAFHEGRVYSFNDEISCSRESPLNIKGAVKAKPLLDLLSKLPEDELDFEVNGKEIVVKGNKRKSGIRMEAEVNLPVDAVEPPEVWRPLHSDFNDAVKITSACVSAEESQFVYVCVHIHPDYLESCDRYQMARYPVPTGVERSVLVRGESLRKVVGLDMTEVSETNSWIHFKNPAGLVFSCRRFLDEYKNLSRYLTPEGTVPVTLPGGLEEMLEKAEIFSGENSSGNHVVVDIRTDRLIIEGQGASGWYKEMKTITYAGDPIRFLIAPKLLVELSKKSNECRVAQGRLYIDTGKFQYVTSTVQEEKPPVVEEVA